MERLEVSGALRRQGSLGVKRLNLPVAIQPCSGFSL